ncbi:hypothetical protein SMGD1_0263 [Sulfurimonas gotlandica GD1]|uniref:Uncharacterized protein n=1 Tax=Sulfurimonas gotlandica (strain DSM 19862 / JCM 16533 / GD1) TaxID=929558 RepID=B6BL53_SULGG|nr:hypothetical protein [Sulfurimonas gotlandica]EDZ62060.1 hypothetical protein CBGD1_2640 [Sulfurimonas gotlandica GD1]EHP28790.1 hypothetical protein SMGD1_0263 [Sulfurimonas gotlandica GD1]
MTNLIYYNKETGSYIQFEIEGEHTYSFFDNETDIKDAANNFVEYAMSKILQFGATIEFPIKLLQELEDEQEIDLFLLAPFNEKIKDALISCIFAIIPENNIKNYFDIKTNSHYISEAVGAESIIICQELYDGKYYATDVVNGGA